MDASEIRAAAERIVSTRQYPEGEDYDADANNVAGAVCGMLAQVAEMRQRLEYLEEYHRIMEQEFAAVFGVTEAIADHFTDDGELKGDGRWRLRSIHKHCKAIDDATHRAAKLLDELSVRWSGGAGGFLSTELSAPDRHLQQEYFP